MTADKKRIIIDQELDKNGVVILPPMDVFKTLPFLKSLGIKGAANMLDPWYNKGFGVVIEEKVYLSDMTKLLHLSSGLTDHIYFWGFPEIVALLMNKWDKPYKLTAWLTWYYKNNPSVIRGWRSAQQACLHLINETAVMHPEHFLNEAQLQKKAEGKLRYMPGPTSVIEDSLLVGFVGRNQQTGHKSQKPKGVYEKLILMATVEDELVIDVMAGSGTTGEVAKMHNRKAILCDISEEYTQMMEKRLGISRISFDENPSEAVLKLSSPIPA